MFEILWSLAFLLQVILLIALYSRLRQMGRGGQDNSSSSAQEAQALIGGAKKQADKILRETNFFTRDVKSTLHKRLEDVTEQIVHDAREQMKDVKDHMQSVAEKHMDKYAEQLGKDLVASSMELDKFREQKRGKIEGEINAYVKNQTAGIEEKMNAQIPAIVREVTGRSIPLLEHEKLVMEALEKAAADGWGETTVSGK